MKHDCRLRSLEVFEDDDGYFFVKDQYSLPSGRNHYLRVEYCPVCGMKSKKSHINHMTMYKRTDIPEAIPEPLHMYQSMMAKAIEDMNKNIECIKAFMISQNTQNECFMDRELEISQKISEITRKLQALEEIK